MQRAGKIICWFSLGLIIVLLLKPFTLELRHLQFYSFWQQGEDDMQRFLQISFLIPFTLFATLQERRSATRAFIILVTLGLTGAVVIYATHNIDRDPVYPSRAVKELFQNRDDSAEKIILQTESEVSNPGNARSAILKVKPYSREMQVVHAADTDHLDLLKWKRIY